MYELMPFVALLEWGTSEHMLQWTGRIRLVLVLVLLLWCCRGAVVVLWCWCCYCVGAEIDAPDLCGGCDAVMSLLLCYCGIICCWKRVC